MLGELALYPKPGKLAGRALDRCTLSVLDDGTKDFDGNLRTGGTPGAYESTDAGPLWRLELASKPVTVSRDSDRIDRFCPGRKPPP
jgi:hypothetical protein